ncbi:hypothetical protein ABZ806_31560 [Spirillospora sp. NPDC047418]
MTMPFSSQLAEEHRTFATLETTDRPGAIACAEAEFTVWTASHLHMTAGMGITPAMRAR